MRADQADQPQVPDDEVEEQSVEDATRLSARLIYEVIRRDGAEELNRPTSSLIFSGLAAGILIAFSVIGEAIFRTHLPKGQDWTFLLENLGYTFGFLLVILGRMQLFTENTITTVLPMMARPSMGNVRRICRLWGLVLGANVVGCFVAGTFMAYSGTFTPGVLTSIGELARHATGFDPWTAFVKALPAGVLIAALVWMLPTAPRNPFPIILAFTWLIAAGDFTHVVAGSVEMAFLLVLGELSPADAAFRFFLPVLAGNVVGGTAVFTLVTWAQVRAEVEET